MKGKTTGELLEELMEPGSFSSYLSRNREQMLHPNVGRELDKLCRGQKLSKAAVARRSGVSEVYLHQVLAGKRSPSRDRLLCLCIGLSAGVEEIQKLLRQAGFAQLDPRITRDALILYGLSRGQSLPQINGALLVQGEKAL
ncbi:XRE family transcriptional regulator [Ruminococcaceae bacterium AM07-15]|nr:XRE family transcriptional regulator [Ruminococcaceae bacterium AM07-15]